MKTVEEVMREMGMILRTQLDGLGFALLVFDFGDAGSMAYVSNAQRDQMIAALDELKEQLQKRPA